MVPSLRGTSLLSTSKFADVGYVTVYDGGKVNVYDGRTARIHVTFQLPRTHIDRDITAWRRSPRARSSAA